ncbi:MAG: hypothetical protein ABFD77_05890 [Thermotogota bacterium]
MGRSEGRWGEALSSRLGRLLVLGLALVMGVAGFAPACAGVQLGRTTITLNSVQYYSGGDYTRFTYQVTTPPGSSAPSYWILGVEDCVDDNAVIWYMSSNYTWVTNPSRGMRFACSSRNQKYYIYLVGNWTTEDVWVAAGWSSPPAILTGSVGGPACVVASISLDIVSGESISFPEIVGAGTYPATSDTVLRVTSSTAGWSLTYLPQFSIPPEASQTVVEGIFRVSLGTHTASAGITDIAVTYALVVDLADFAGLPQGTYVITIAYTVSTD